MSGIYFLNSTNKPKVFPEINPYFYDPNSDTTTDILTQGDLRLVRFFVSPDHTRLLSQQFTGSTLIDVLGSNGESLATIYPEEDWMDTEWFTDQSLLVSYNTYTTTYNSEYGSAKDFSYFLLDPFTGTRQYLTADYPDMFAWDPIYFWTHYQTYNSTLTRVMYPNMRLDTPVILWDLQNNREIGRYPYGEDAIWSPDGTKLSMIADYANNQITADEIFMIDEDGEYTNLTSLTDTLSGANIYYYSWSPDSQSIAFWFSSKEFTGYSSHLAVVDVTTGFVTDYCLQGSGIPSSFLWVNLAPIWSPDGKYLVVNSYNDDTYSSEVFLIDLQNNQAVKIGEDVHAWGWMLSPE